MKIKDYNEWKLAVSDFYGGSVDEAFIELDTAYNTYCDFLSTDAKTQIEENVISLYAYFMLKIVNPIEEFTFTDVIPNDDMRNWFHYFVTDLPTPETVLESGGTGYILSTVGIELLNQFSTFIYDDNTALENFRSEAGDQVKARIKYHVDNMQNPPIMKNTLDPSNDASMTEAVSQLIRQSGHLQDLIDEFNWDLQTTYYGIQML